MRERGLLGGVRAGLAGGCDLDHGQAGRYDARCQAAGAPLHGDAQLRADLIREYPQVGPIFA